MQCFVGLQQGTPCILCMLQNEGRPPFCFSVARCEQMQNESGHDMEELLSHCCHCSIEFDLQMQNPAYKPERT